MPAPPEVSVTTELVETRARRPSAVTVLRIGATVALASTILNLLILTVARAADTELLVRQPGAAEAMQISAGAVVTMTLAAVILGTLALLVARRWGARGWRVLARAGLAIGLITVVMPLSVDADSATRLTLASMHIVVGVVWFLIVRRQQPVIR